MISAGADASEGCFARSSGELLVPVDDARPDFGAEGLIKLGVLRKESGGKTESRGVGFLDGGLEAAAADNPEQGAEDLLVAPVGAFRYVDESGRDESGLPLETF